ncbi:DJ-1/PfpI family protein, partial [Mycolicibacterium sp. CBMA 361]
MDIVGPHDVFTGAGLQLAAEPQLGGYDVSLVALNSGPVRTLTGLEFFASAAPEPGTAIDTVIIPGGFGTEAVRGDRAVIEWIRAVAPNTRRMVSVCSGAFLLAEAGLLDGCRATTHWASAEHMARE